MAPDHAVCSGAVRNLSSPPEERGEEMSIFPTKILLATDGSRDAELALSTAIDLADSTNSELHVVTVAPGYPSYDVGRPEIVEQLREQAEKILEDQVKKIEEAGGKVAEKHLRIAERYRADQIVQVAEDVGAGLVVMGSRGLGGVRRALMGSVSDSVVRHAHCPVLVVRPEKEQAA
jgi:nucleotide-binding universal stress UspA family protein